MAIRTEPQARSGPRLAAPGSARAGTESTGRRWPARMQLVSANASELCFRGRTPLLASSLLAPLSLVLAGLPWISAAPVDAVRGLVSCFFLGAAGTVIFTTWPRRLLVKIACSQRELSIGSHKSSLRGQLRWLLCAEERVDGPDTAYVARLELENGREWVLLRDKDPTRVLAQLHELQECWPQPVESRWGLPDAVRPWEIDPAKLDATPRKTPPAQVVIHAPQVHKDLRWSIALMTLLVLVYLTFLVSTAGGVVEQIHPLSVVLPIVLGAIMLTLSVSLATWRTQLLIAESHTPSEAASGRGERVWVETCMFGLRRPTASVSLESLRGVYVLGAAASERWHLLLCGSEGALALPVPQSQAPALALRTQAELSARRRA